MKISSLLSALLLTLGLLAATDATAAPETRVPSANHASHNGNHTSHNGNFRSGNRSIHMRHGDGRGVYFGGIDQDDDTCGWYHHRHRMFPLGILLHLGLDRC